MRGPEGLSSIYHVVDIPLMCVLDPSELCLNPTRQLVLLQRRARCRSGGPPWRERRRWTLCGPRRSGELGPHALGEGDHLPVELGAVGREEFEDQVLDPAVCQLKDLLDEACRL